MIFELIWGFIADRLSGLFDFIAFVTFPITTIDVLTPVLAYGNAILGIDIVLGIILAFAFWTGVKLSAGFAFFVYEKIPFI
ncbi:MAG: hypothetical protein WAT96_07365 [Streptococcus suis]